MKQIITFLALTILYSCNKNQSEDKKEESIKKDTISTVTDSTLKVNSAYMGINETWIFKGEKNRKIYEVSLTLTSPNKMTYVFKNPEFKDEFKGIVTSKGGDSESDTDDKTQESYLSEQFLEESKDCFFSIRIGGEKPNFKVKIIRECKDGKNLSLDNCPTLYLEK